MICRLGVVDLYTTAILDRIPKNVFDTLSVRCLTSSEIAQDLYHRNLDVGCLLAPPHNLLDDANLWDEEIVWVRHETFWPERGADLPIIVAFDLRQIVVNQLDTNDEPYEIVFSGSFSMCLAAVRKGFGFFSMPRRFIRSPLCLALSKRLPIIPPVRSAFCYRTGPPTSAIREVFEVMAWEGRQQSATDSSTRASS